MSDELNKIVDALVTRGFDILRNVIDNAELEVRGSLNVSRSAQHSPTEKTYSSADGQSKVTIGAPQLPVQPTQEAEQGGTV